MHRSTTVLITTLAILATVPVARGQTPGPTADEARAAFETCLKATGGGRLDDARAAADLAERALEAWIQASPEDPEPRVFLARTLSQCRIPQASFMEQGVLIGRSNALLEEALELVPTHWGARYTLALNHYYTPEFLGRTKDSIHHFEVLIEQQGERVDVPEFAMPYAYLGDLYLRVGRREDAIGIWRRGAALFQDHAALAERLAGAGTPSTGADATTGEASASPALASGLADGDTVAMEGIVVQARGGFGMDDSRPQATLRRLDIYTAPGGTADILQVFQMLPGMTRVTEGADLYVRGGDPAESPVLIEGARLLQPGVFATPAGSVFGLLDPAILARAWFSSGGFSVRYGDALSGVVELETDGRPTTASWRAGGNFAGGGVTMGRPLGDRTGTWASVRFTETSILLALHGDKDDYPSVPRSIEGVGGWVAQPRPGLELKAMGLLQRDAVTREVDAIGWRGPFESHNRTALALLTGRAVAADGGRSLRATASVTTRGNDFAFGVLDREKVDRAFAFRVEGDLAPRASLALRLGAEARRLTASEAGRVPTTERLAPGSPARPLDDVGDDGTLHTGAWLEGELHPLPQLALVAGARVDRLPGEVGATVDPRFAVAWQRGAWTWRAAGGTFQQGRWRVGYELPDRGETSGLPRRARHLAFGMERDGDLSLKIEGFMKRYDRYVPHGDGPLARRGEAIGLDVLIRKSGSERWDGWLAYSLLRGRVRLEDDRLIPSDYDVTHSLTAVGRYRRGPWELGLTGRYATGRPNTPILGAEPDSDEGGFPTPRFGDPNGQRLPAYVRVDARVTRFIPVGPRLLVWYLEMLNVTNHTNVDRLVYDHQWENPQPIEGIFDKPTFVTGIEVQL